MAYFGNTPLQSTYLTDYLSGDNSTVAFTLARAPISAQSVLVHISGVKQHASTYGVAGTTLTFSEAPPTGTNNIEVLHLGISPETVTLPSYRTITEFTATAGQTTFSPASYTVGYIDVFRNGVKLGTADFTASNGTTVVLTVGCTDGDLVRFEGFLITTFNDAIPNTAGAVGDSLIAGVSASKVSGVLTDANMPAGSVLQVKNYQFGSLLSLGNVQIPYDDTIPQITEGGEVMTLTITPQSASSKLMIEVLVNASPSLSGEKMVVSLFQDTTVDAIACVSEELYDSSYMVAIPLRHFMSSPGTSAVTFSVRAGRTDSSANSFTINGYLGARKFGGALATSITITEIAD